MQASCQPWDLGSVKDGLGQMVQNNGVGQVLSNTNVQNILSNTNIQNTVENIFKNPDVQRSIGSIGTAVLTNQNVKDTLERFNLNTSSIQGVLQNPLLEQVLGLDGKDDQDDSGSHRADLCKAITENPSALKDQDTIRLMADLACSHIQK